jgi:hypothetical protein
MTRKEDKDRLAAKHRALTDWIKERHEYADFFVPMMDEVSVDMALRAFNIGRIELNHE